MRLRYDGAVRRHDLWPWWELHARSLLEGDERIFRLCSEGATTVRNDEARTRTNDSVLWRDFASEHQGSDPKLQRLIA